MKLTVDSYLLLLFHLCSIRFEPAASRTANSCGKKVIVSLLQQLGEHNTVKKYPLRIAKLMG